MKIQTKLEIVPCSLGALAREALSLFLYDIEYRMIPVDKGNQDEDSLYHDDDISTDVIPRQLPIPTALPIAPTRSSLDHIQGEKPHNSITKTQQKCEHGTGHRHQESHNETKEIPLNLNENKSAKKNGAVFHQPACNDICQSDTFRQKAIHELDNSSFSRTCMSSTPSEGYKENQEIVGKEMNQKIERDSFRSMQEMIKSNIFQTSLHTALSPSNSPFNIHTIDNKTNEPTYNEIQQSSRELELHATLSSQEIEKERILQQMRRIVEDHRNLKQCHENNTLEMERLNGKFQTSRREVQILAATKVRLERDNFSLRKRINEEVRRADGAVLDAHSSRILAEETSSKLRLAIEKSSSLEGEVEELIQITENEIGRDLEVTREENSRLSGQVQHLGEDARNRVMEVVELEGQREQARGELQSLRHLVDSLRDENNRLRKEVDVSRSSVVGNSEQMIGLQRMVSKSQHEADELHKLASELDFERNTLHELLEEERNKALAATEQIRKLVWEKEKLSCKINEVSARLGNNKKDMLKNSLLDSSVMSPSINRHPSIRAWQGVQTPNVDSSDLQPSSTKENLSHLNISEMIKVNKIK